MFLGDFKTKNKISLGRTRTQDKAELMAKAINERITRERERTVLKAACKLQAFWKDYSHLIALKNNIRSSWDMRTVLIDDLPDYLAQFLFFYSKSLDRTRLFKLSDILVSFPASITSKRYFFLLCRLVPLLIPELHEYQNIQLHLCRLIQQVDSYSSQLYEHMIRNDLLLHARISIEKGQLEAWSLLKPQATSLEFYTLFVTCIFTLPLKNRVSKSQVKPFLEGIFKSLPASVNSDQASILFINTMHFTDTFSDPFMAALGKLISCLPENVFASDEETLSLSSTSIIESLEDLLKSIPTIISGLKTDLSSLSAFASLLLSITTRWPIRKGEILNKLLLSKISVLSLIYKVIKVGEIWNASLDKMDLIPLFSMKEEWVLYILFSELFTKMLGTMADDEFFSPQSTMCLDDIIAISHRYKAIHKRDSRKAFCPVDHWHIRDDLLNRIISYFLSSSFPEALSSQLECFSLILQNIPFIIPFETRVKIFRSFIDKDRRELNLDQYILHPAARVTIKRSSVFEDGYTYLNSLGQLLKGKIAITFISDQGLEEVGIDGGGVFKEFLTSLSKQAFNANYGLFSATKDNLLYPCPYLYATQDQQLSHFQFLGRIIGKALYEGVLIDAAFADFFLAKWIGRQSFLDDLPSLDPELYSGLMFLKSYSGDVQELGLNFTVSTNEFGESKELALVPNGSSIPVTNDNRIQYIYLCSHYKVNTQIQKQCSAFFRGLQDLIHPQWLRIFNQHELSILLGGVEMPIDLEDLERNVSYSGFTRDHATIVIFWKVLHSFSASQVRDLIKFVTSCPRPPLLGFSELRPSFCVRNIGDQVDRLPTASTCINLLKMPEYANEEMLREKLLYAISAEAGFDLS